ncbi:MAG: hypothetical protein LBK54_00465 [Propionibacteriaceae bacterium]|jgi:hypothetical protein|nr:hypothetical protein [Propionibacteriaceae bacterium]
MSEFDTALHDFYALREEYEALLQESGMLVKTGSSVVLWEDQKKDDLLDAAPGVEAKLSALRERAKDLQARAEALSDYYDGHGFLAVSKYKLGVATLGADISRDLVSLQSGVRAAEDSDHRKK